MTTLGDHLYHQDADVTLYCGDNRVILPLLDEESIDVVVTSPPYNAGIERFKASGFMKEAPMAKWIDKMAAGYQDSLPEDEYQAQQVEVLDALHRVLTPSGSVFYNHKDRWRDKELLDPIEWLRKSKLRLRQRIIWNRGMGIQLNARMYFNAHEYVFWLVKGKKWAWNQEAVGHGSVWSISPAFAKRTEHACVFPEALVARCLDGVAKPGQVACDPYAGSGTTAVVARKFGLKTILIEREPRYCEVIVERLSQTVLPMFDGHAEPAEESFAFSD